MLNDLQYMAKLYFLDRFLLEPFVIGFFAFFLLFDFLLLLRKKKTSDLQKISIDLIWFASYKITDFVLICSIYFLFLKHKQDSIEYPSISLSNMVIQILTCLITMDFFHYWIHRWRHRVRFLWPFHTIHHGANHLGILMGIRVHPIESIIIRILFLLPLLLLKELFGSVAWLSGVIYLYYAYCTHMDIPMSFGKFDKLLVSPLVHRIHHLTDFDKYSFNFAQMFSFWDVLFLTYMDPNYINDLLKKPLGIKEKRLFPSDENLVNANIFLIYWKQLLYPIKNYLKLIR